jgi:hypothetical protein
MPSTSIWVGPYVKINDEKNNATVANFQESKLLVYFLYRVYTFLQIFCFAMDGKMGVENVCKE